MHPRLPHAPSGADVVHVVEEPLFVLPVALGFGPKDDPPGYTFIVRAENALGREVHGPRWVESYRLSPPLNLPPPSSRSSKDPDVRREASSLLQKLDDAIWEHEVMVARQAGADVPARPGPDPTKIPSLNRAKAARPNYRSSGDVDAAWADAYSSRVRFRSEALEAGTDPDAEEVEHRHSPEEILSDAEYERAWRRDQAVTEQWKLVMDVRRHLLRELQSGAISASVRPYDGGPWRALAPGDWNADLALIQRRFMYGAMDPDRPFPGRGKPWPSGWWIFIENRAKQGATEDLSVGSYFSSEEGVVTETFVARERSEPGDISASGLYGEPEDGRPPAYATLQEAVDAALAAEPRNAVRKRSALEAIKLLGWNSWPDGSVTEIYQKIRDKCAPEPSDEALRDMIRKYHLNEY